MANVMKMNETLVVLTETELCLMELAALGEPSHDGCSCHSWTETTRPIPYVSIGQTAAEWHARLRAEEVR